MSDTQTLLSKIAALRQRLEQAQGAASRESADRGEVLRHRVEAGAAHDALVDEALCPLVGAAAEAPLPTRLTARARRVLETGRELLARLRPLAEQVETGGADAADPLVRFYRDTAAMTDTTLRMVQALPDAPSAQLRLCEGLEAILAVISRRVDLLANASARRREEEQRIASLAGLLGALAAGQTPDVQPFLALAEAVTVESLGPAPLRFLYAPPEQPARFVACHSLTVAQVMARVVRLDPELRGRTTEAVLAALVHDAGMLRVPATVLAHAGSLDDSQRRAVEAHTRAGADLARRLLPEAAWLAEAALAHHERLDGTGYPGGLREVQVSSLARLLAVCDVYAALCAPRPHRPARDTRTALADTLLLAEQGALDARHAERLLQLSFYPVGSAVELADGSAGVVVATHPGRRELTNPARPVIALLTDDQGRALPAPVYLDLAHSDGHSIVRGLAPSERRTLLGARFPEWA